MAFFKGFGGREIQCFLGFPKAVLAIGMMATMAFVGPQVQDLSSGGYGEPSHHVHGNLHGSH